MTFDELGLNAELLDAISYMGFKEASPIQEQAIPTVLKGSDIIGCAQTGTGKTAAFLLPVLHELIENPSEDTKALIVVPTRELAIQIDQQIQGIAYFTDINSITIYGGGEGTDFSEQKKALSEGTNIVVATPGKLISHLNMGYVNFSKLKYLILDEADRMFDMGFQDDIQKIISHTPETRQNLLFSATMEDRIRNFAKKFLKEPVEFNLALAKPAEGVTQRIFLVYDQQKTPLIAKFLKVREDYQSIIIFTSNKAKVRTIIQELKQAGIEAHGISSDYDQSQREEVLLKFRARKIKVLVGTDVISRGIDIKDINMVVNYDVPNEAADYVHRVGRTARASTKGEAVTLVNEKDMRKFERIEKLIETDFEKQEPPISLGDGPKWRVSKGGGGNRKFSKKPSQK